MGGEQDTRRVSAAAALLALALLAAAVALGRAAPFDAWAAAVVRRAASPGVDLLARAASALASGPVTAVAVALVAAAALLRGARRTAVVVAASWAASVTGAQLLKALVARPRPSFPYTVAALPSAAFPSGHAMNAVIVWGLLAALAARRWPREGPLARGAALALALLAGLSRIYLGVHHPTDVLGGWAAGAAVLAGLATALPPGRPADARPAGPPSA